MKKIIIIAIAVIVLAVVGVALFSVFSKSGSAAPGIAGSAGSSANAPKSDGGIPAAQAFHDAPQGSTFTVQSSAGSVTVRNFYLDNPTVVEGGILVLKKTSDYVITYSRPDAVFDIEIIGMPFDVIRPAAEADLLSILNVNQTDACRLAADVWAPGQATIPLSFCK